MRGRNRRPQLRHAVVVALCRGVVDHAQGGEAITDGVEAIVVFCLLLVVGLAMLGRCPPSRGKVGFVGFLEVDLQLGPRIVLEEEYFPLEDTLGSEAGGLDGYHLLVHHMFHGECRERDNRGHVELFQVEEVIFIWHGDVPCGTEVRLVRSLPICRGFAVSYVERVEYRMGIRIFGIVPPLPHGRHHIGIICVGNCEVQILVDGAADVIIHVFATTVRLPDDVGIHLLNWRHRSVRSYAHWYRVNIIHPCLYSIERLELHLIHHSGKAMLGRLLGGGAADLRKNMCHERADVGCCWERRQK